MRLLTTLLILSLFLIACNSEQPSQQQITQIDPQVSDTMLTPEEEDAYWAKENFDLQRVGSLLERSDNPEEFEAFLNDDDGVNNLDLNGDGYADYISVDEFEDRDGNSRGLSLFTRFGPDLIQEIATIFFYRDRPDYRGSRIFLSGNDQIYGDNYYYETNWLDRSLGIAQYLFSDRDNYYRSPYYYDNYPSDYVAYEVVDTPVYVSRIQRLYPEPAFVYTNAAPEYFSNVKIKSPHNGKWIEKVHAKLTKPKNEQAAYFKNNGRRAKRGELGSVDQKPGRPDPPRSDRGDERGNPSRDERGAERGNPNRGNPDQGNPDKGNPNKGNPNKGAPNQGPPAGNPGRVDPKPGKPDNPGKGQGQGQGKGGGQGKGKGKP